MLKLVNLLHSEKQVTCPPPKMVDNMAVTSVIQLKF